MAEKAFKVPSLGLVGTTAELDFASGDLRWNTLPLATESYVDSAVGNVTVNVEALAGDALAYDAVNNELDVNAEALSGHGIAGSGSTLTVDVSAIAGEGLYEAVPYINGPATLAVNTNAVASNITNNLGTVYSQDGKLKVRLGGGLYEETDGMLNTNSIAINFAGITGFGLRSSGSSLFVNANSLVGSGLYAAEPDAFGNTVLAINTNVIATRAYVDAVAEGLHIHESVRAATTQNVNLANALEAGDTLDSNVTLIAGDRILVKNQTTASENGIYVVQASGQPTRATDFDTAAEVDSGDFVFVREGATQAATGWVQVNQPATIGTDAIAFTQFSGAGTYTAGNGLDLTGNTFSVNPGIGIWINSDTVAVNTNALAGNGLTGGFYDLSVNPGAGIWLDSDAVAVNANALAGDGLTSATGASLAINPGFGIVLRSDAVVVNTNALAGAGLAGGWDSLSVNTNAVAQSLVGTGLYVTNGDDLAVNVNTFITQSYGAKTLTVRNNESQVKYDTAGKLLVQSTDSNTYVTIGTLDFSETDGLEFFDVDVAIKVENKTRSSKLSGVLVTGDNPDYTEYAIVENNGTITDADVRINSSNQIQVKAVWSSGTGYAIARMSSMGFKETQIGFSA